MHPFFSVCIPATGRSRTIERAIQSVIDQNFTDIELIITMRSDLLTYHVANTYLSRQDPNFRFKVVNIDKEVLNCNDWNDSIELSSGNFIVMLEGDDYFYNGYLEAAYKTIEKYNCDVCLFATTNRDKEPSPFTLNNLDFFDFIYRLKAVPAPSESIFPRVHKNDLILYDINNYVYAPEIDLYLRLTASINNFVRLREKYVFRHPSSDPNNRISKLYYTDHLSVLLKYYHIRRTPVFLTGIFNLIIAYCRSLIKYFIWKIRS